MKKEFTDKTIDTVLEKVVLFNKVAGNSEGDTSLIPIYTQLTKEEFFQDNEFLQSYFKDDVVGMADGIGDLLFTGGYLSILQGNNIYFENNISHKFNMKEIIGSLSFDLITCNDPKVLGALCYSLSRFMDVEGVFNRIFESNMSKFLHKDLVMEDVLEKEIEFIESNSRYGDIEYKLVGDYYVFLAGKDIKNNMIFNKPKIVKPSTYSSPEDLGGLEEFIYE